MWSLGVEGNPNGFLDSDVEGMIHKWGYEWRERRIKRLMENEWKGIAEFLLSYIVDFVGSELLEGDVQFKQFDLALRILGEDGSLDGEGRRAISKAFWNLDVEKNNSNGQQDDVDDRFEAREGMIAVPREQLAELTTRKNSSELEEQLAYQTHSVVLITENGMQMKEKLQVAERKAEKAEENPEEKWGAWAEQEAQVKAVKATLAEWKKWQANGKALPVERVSIGTQTDHIQEATVV